ncbi:response regulator [Mucilaginibacter ginkgonis]|uniref:Response regulator transcription factor n=1 Tax=Mucilaginibacter ginkgonis TaxID=2682091 RepID=A0A6I4HYT8_9SPHI|nr:response regulator [Mucilaginibacter ginkgonis]QQL50235.1 response regulator transcription factor [Mucilaginibacter ginkgonis]
MSGSLTKKKILVLDQDWRMLSTINQISEHGDFDIHIIYDSNSVYQKAKFISPDLIILDYLLIGNDCGLICQDLKDDELLHTIPIIIVTAFKTSKVKLDAYRYDALFVKPLDMNVLATRIDYLMAS